MKTPVCLANIFKYSAILLCLLITIVIPVSAQLNYTTFSSGNINDFNFLSDAEINGNALRLIRGQNSGHAAIWENNKHRVTDGFVSIFTFRIINGNGDTGGADGFAFVIQNSSIGNQGGIGGRGGNIGYGRDANPAVLTPGIKNSIAIEFDTYENADLNDPNNNHISVHTKGPLENSANEDASIASTASIPSLRGGAVHTIRVEYDGPTGSTPHEWRIFLGSSNTPLLTFVRNLSNILANNDSDAWIGFTAGSAAEWENHDILSWSFSPVYPDNQLPFTAPNADTPGPSSVLSYNYHPGADGEGNNPDAKIDAAVLPDRKTELWAKYYFPENLSGGPYPLVVLKHGNHGTCGYGSNPRMDDRIDYTSTGICPDVRLPTGVIRDYKPVPSHEGYDYLANKLASWGYIVVSINSNLGITQGIPYRKFTFTEFDNYSHPEDIQLILARGRLVLRHLQQLSEWNDGVTNFVKTTTVNKKELKANKTGWYGKELRTLNDPIKIKALGRLYENGNDETHSLRIVRASDNVVVAETSVAMTNWTHEQYKYGELTNPVILAPNTLYYLVSEERKKGDKWREVSITTKDLANFENDIVSTDGGNTWGNYNKTIPLDFIYELDSTTPSEFGLTTNLKGKIDFSNVGFMGHSRGGEGVRAAYNIYEPLNSQWRMRIRKTLKVKGIFEFAPTDRFVIDSSGDVTLLNADKTAWNVLLPACDGDVFYQAGVKPFDRMLNNNAESEANQKSVFYVYGTNHNFYNTQWQESDSYLRKGVPVPEPNGCVGVDNTPLFIAPSITGTGFGSESQQNTGSSPFMAFMRGNVGNSVNPNFNQNFDPRFKLPAELRAITKFERSYTPSPGISHNIVLHDLQDDNLENNVCSDSKISCSSGVTAESTFVQRRNDFNLINHDEDFTAIYVSWASANPGRFIQVDAESGNINASTFETLDFRISRRRSTSNILEVDSLNEMDITNMSIQLVMTDNSISKSIGISEYIRLAGPVGTSNKTDETGTSPIGELHPILRTVRIPLSKISRADLTKIKGVRFIFNHTSKGAVNLSNVRFSK